MSPYFQANAERGAGFTVDDVGDMATQPRPAKVVRPGLAAFHKRLTPEQRARVAWPVALAHAGTWP